MFQRKLLQADIMAFCTAKITSIRMYMAPDVRQITLELISGSQNKLAAQVSSLCG